MRKRNKESKKKSIPVSSNNDLGNKTPYITPKKSIKDEYRPKWRFSFIDMDGPFGWSRIQSKELVEIINKAKHFETQNWNEIQKTNNHYIDVVNLCSEAQKRLIDLRLDDYDKVFSLRTQAKERIFGILETYKEAFLVLWWDPKHQICKSEKKYT